MRRSSTRTEAARRAALVGTPAFETLLAERERALGFDMPAAAVADSAPVVLDSTPHVVDEAPPDPLPVRAPRAAAEPARELYPCSSPLLHRDSWLYRDEVRRFVCTRCHPALAAAVEAHSWGRTTAWRPPSSDALSRAERAALRARILAWGAARGYPRLPFAWARGAGSGAARPYKTLCAGEECWRTFTSAPDSDTDLRLVVAAIAARGGEGEPVQANEEKGSDPHGL